MGNSRSGLYTQRKVCVGGKHPGLQKARDLPRLVERLPSINVYIECIKPYILSLAHIKLGMVLIIPALGEAGGPEIQNSKSSSVNLRPA